MGPDMMNRIRAVLLMMILWMALSTAVILIFPFYWSLVVIGGLGIFFSAWAALYLFANRHQPAVFSRMLLAGAGVMAAWGALMFVASPLIWSFLPDGVDLWQGTHSYAGALSILVNIVLALVMLVMPIFLQRIKPGEYFLISTLGQSNPPYVIEHAGLSSGRFTSASKNPGELIGSGKRLWIRPVDTARLIWSSQKTLLYEDNLRGLATVDSQNVDLHVKLFFTFDPREVVVPDFALQLQDQRSMDDVEKLLLRIIADEVHQQLWRYINRLPHNVATSAEIIRQLPTLLKQRMILTEKMLGLPMNDAKSAVEILASPQVTVHAADWQSQNRQRLQEMTAGAERGDPIARLLLWLYLLEHPEARTRILPDSRDELRIGDVDFLLAEMNRDPSFREGMVRIMLESGSNALAAPAGGSLGVGTTPTIEGPEIQLACTAQGSVSFVWSNLDGELYLHWDGHTEGPIFDRQGYVDTRQPVIQQADYTWNRQTYPLGSFDCRQPAASPPPQPDTSNAAIPRRRFGPSRQDHTVNTRRNDDGSFEPTDD